MSDDLNTSFHRAVDSAVDQAMTADEMRRAVAERIRAKRRRRPALVIGSTLGSLALVGGTAFAAVQLAGDDEHGPVPDVIGSPRPGVSAAPTPTEETTTTPAVEPVATLPVADPSAVFPQCGATAELGTRTPENATGRIHMTTPTDLSTLSVPGPASLVVSLDNRELSTVAGDAEATIPLVLAREGIVVGRAQDAAPAMEAFELGGAKTREVEGTLWIQACTPGGTAVGTLPAGRYEVWTDHRYTVTARTSMQGDSTQGDLLPVDESYVSRFAIADLWIDETGSPTQSPYQAAGMPSVIDTVTVMAGVADTSVVWLALPSDDQSVIDAASAATTALGYGDALWPFMCQGAAGDVFGPDDTLRSGVALVFATRAEADRFTATYEGDVAGTVDGDVFCHFD
ncbi:hypothetical protein [Sanguibacter sp. 25GB23B1]|uniref:hypothetical protein n=1 Tax=unclassified Sanguibacter TaxID=2645534 RepID=UPI0032AE9D7C